MTEAKRPLWDGTLDPTVKPGDPPKFLGFNPGGGEWWTWPIPVEWTEPDFKNFKSYGWKA